MVLSNSEIKKLINDNFHDERTRNILVERVINRTLWNSLYCKYGNSMTRDRFIGESIRAIAKLNIIIRKQGGERII